MPLREAICAWHKQNSVSYSRRNAWSAWAEAPIFNAASVLVQANDEVQIPAPYWVSFPDIVKYRAQRRCMCRRVEDGFAVRRKRLKSHYAENALRLNSPSNPVAGAPPDNTKILAVCKRIMWLMGDECYSHFTYVPHKPYSVPALPARKKTSSLLDRSQRRSR